MVMINSVKDKLQGCIDGVYTLYNRVSKKDVPVTEEHIDSMTEYFIDMINGHGIEHLQFIKKDKRKEDS